MSKSLLVTVLLSLFVSSCQTSIERRRQSNICHAFDKWVEAGPRVTTGDRKLTLPDAYTDDFETTGLIVLTSFKWDYHCPENSCEDEADEVLKNALAAYAHTVSGSLYFNFLEGCVTKFNPYSFENTERFEEKILVKKKYRGAIVTMKWSPELNESEIVVEYP